MPYTFTLDGELPELCIPSPYCGHCHNDVAVDGDTAWCDTCLVKWETVSEDAAVVDTDQTDTDGALCETEPTEKTRPRYDYIGKHWSFGDYQPCILPKGHKGDHRHPITCTTTEIQ